MTLIDVIEPIIELRAASRVHFTDEIGSFQQELLNPIETDLDPKRIKRVRFHRSLIPERINNVFSIHLFPRPISAGRKVGHETSGQDPVPTADTTATGAADRSQSSTAIDRDSDTVRRRLKI